MSPACLRASASETFRCSRIISAICLSTVMTGLRLVIGSWKIIAIFPPRTVRISASLFLSRSSPSKRISPDRTTPGGEGIRRMMPSAVVVLPAPVSPTKPRVSPRPSRRFRPSTACTVPLSVTYWIVRSRTSSRRSVLFSFLSIFGLSIDSVPPLRPRQRFSFGSSASRRPSPRKLKARMVTEIAAAGKKSCHG